MATALAQKIASMMIAGIAARDHWTMNTTIEPKGILTSVTITSRTALDGLPLSSLAIAVGVREVSDSASCSLRCVAWDELSIDDTARRALIIWHIISWLSRVMTFGTGFFHVNSLHAVKYLLTGFYCALRKDITRATVSRAIEYHKMRFYQAKKEGVLSPPILLMHGGA